MRSGSMRQAEGVAHFDMRDMRCQLPGPERVPLGDEKGVVEILRRLESRSGVRMYVTAHDIMVSVEHKRLPGKMQAKLGDPGLIFVRQAETRKWPKSSKELEGEPTWYSPLVARRHEVFRGPGFWDGHSEASFSELPAEVATDLEERLWQSTKERARTHLEEGAPPAEVVRHLKRMCTLEELELVRKYGVIKLFYCSSCSTNMPETKAMAPFRLSADEVWKLGGGTLNGLFGRFPGLMALDTEGELRNYVSLQVNAPAGGTIASRGQENDLQPGDIVRIHGLQKARELNGEQASLISFDAASQRWGVRLLGLGAEMKSIRPVNLRRDLDSDECAFPGCCQKANVGLDQTPKRMQYCCIGHMQEHLRQKGMEPPDSGSIVSAVPIQFDEPELLLAGVDIVRHEFLLPEEPSRSRVIEPSEAAVRAVFEDVNGRFASFPHGKRCNFPHIVCLAGDAEELHDIYELITNLENQPCDFRGRERTKWVIEVAFNMSLEELVRWSYGKFFLVDFACVNGHLTVANYRYIPVGITKEEEKRAHKLRASVQAASCGCTDCSKEYCRRRYLQSFAREVQTVQELLEIDGDYRRCAQCLVFKQAVNGKSMDLCSGCRQVCYCSSACQKMHWKRGGHKQVCKDLHDFGPHLPHASLALGLPEGSNYPQDLLEEDQRGRGKYNSLDHREEWLADRRRALGKNSQGDERDDSSEELDVDRHAWPGLACGEIDWRSAPAQKECKERGDKHLAAGDLAAANACYSEGIERSSPEQSKPLAVLYASRCFARCRMGETQAALEDGEAATEADNQCCKAFCNFGQALRAHGHFACAARVLRGVLKCKIGVTREDVEACRKCQKLLELACRLMLRGSYTVAAEVILELIQLQGDFVDDEVRLRTESLRYQSLVQAACVGDLAAEKLLADARNRCEKFERGRAMLALETVEAKAALFADLGSAACDAKEGSFATDRIPEGAAWYSLSVHQNPGVLSREVHLGVLLMKLTSYDQAIDVLSKGISRETEAGSFENSKQAKETLAKAYCQLGTCYMQRGQRQQQEQTGLEMEKSMIDFAYFVELGHRVDPAIADTHLLDMYSSTNEGSVGHANVLPRNLNDLKFTAVTMLRTAFESKLRDAALFLSIMERIPAEWWVNEVPVMEHAVEGGVPPSDMRNVRASIMRSLTNSLKSGRSQAYSAGGAKGQQAPPRKTRRGNHR